MTWPSAIKLGLLISMASTLTACSLAPAYVRPTSIQQDHYVQADPVEASSAGIVWKVAEPSDHFAKGEWWKVFADPTLDHLESEAMASNQGVAAALARLEKARALERTAGASLLPEIATGFGPTRQKRSSSLNGETASSLGAPINTVWRAGVRASYEADLFGRVGSTIAVAKAQTLQSEQLLQGVRLSLQADIAQGYFALRALDAEELIVSRIVETRQRELQLVTRRFEHGDANEFEVSTIEAELAIVRSGQLSLSQQRMLAEHQLAALTGSFPVAFRLPKMPIEPVTIQLPAGLPSYLLERRPDVAAAERAVAAANASIGIAKAAFYPSVIINGSAGYESAKYSELLKSSSKVFLLGPLVGTLVNLALFDGGRRKGELAHASADLDEKTADYRSTVINAVREVEDSLATLRILRTQAVVQEEVVCASARAATISRLQFDRGAARYAEVLQADRTSLATQRARIELLGVQAIATVNLIRALGGGWGEVEATASLSNKNTR